MLGTNCDMMCDVIDGLIRKTIVGLDGISGKFLLSSIVCVRCTSLL